jgi:hypothetical protein
MSTYLPTAGGFIAAPPFRHRGAILHGMLLPGSKVLQQSLVNATLNRCPGMAFEVLSPLVLLTALYVSEVTSTDEDWAGRGVTSEVDIGVWTLVGGGRDGDRAMRWHPQYLFVDSATAMAIGREIYGFPKHLARVIRADPDPDPKDPRVAVELQTIEVLGPSEKPSPCQPIQITLATDPAPLRAKREPDAINRETLASELGEVLFEYAFDALPVDPPYLGGLPAIFLRQYRDIVDPRRAAYQAVTTLDIAADGVPRGIGFLPEGIEVLFPLVQSLNIGPLLGLNVSTRPVGPAFWMDFDFTAGFGAEYG